MRERTFLFNWWKKQKEKWFINKSMKEIDGQEAWERMLWKLKKEGKDVKEIMRVYGRDMGLSEEEIQEVICRVAVFLRQ